MYVVPMGHCRDLALMMRKMGSSERFEHSNGMVLVIFS